MDELRSYLEVDKFINNRNVARSERRGILAFTREVLVSRAEYWRDERQKINSHPKDVVFDEKHWRFDQVY